jgi:hypothetical protein
MVFRKVDRDWKMWGVKGPDCLQGKCNIGDVIEDETHSE